MRALQLFFQLHHSYTIKDLTEVDSELFAGEADFREADRLEYQPFFAILERNIQRFPSFKISLAVTGIWLEQAEKWDPDLLRRLRRLVDKGNIELVLTPYGPSLAWFYDRAEFEAQISAASSKLSRTFGVSPEILALPALIYNDQIADWAKDHDFSAILIGACEWMLDFRTVNQIFAAKNHPDLRLIPQNTAFSQMILQASPAAMTEIFEKNSDFSATSPGQTPKNPRHKLSAAEFLQNFTKTTPHSAPSVKAPAPTGRLVFSAPKVRKQLELASLQGNLINLCLDTTIFRKYRSQEVIKFFDELIAGWFSTNGSKFLTASEIAKAMSPRHLLSVKNTIDSAFQNSSAYQEQDPKNPKKSTLSNPADLCYKPPAWLSQESQKSQISNIFSLHEPAEKTKNPTFLRDFSRLTDISYLTAPSNPVLLENITAELARRINAVLPQPLQLKTGHNSPKNPENQPKTADSTDSKPQNPQNPTENPANSPKNPKNQPKTADSTADNPESPAEIPVKISKNPNLPTDLTKETTKSPEKMPGFTPDSPKTPQSSEKITNLPTISAKNPGKSSKNQQSPAENPPETIKVQRLKPKPNDAPPKSLTRSTTDAPNPHKVKIKAASQQKTAPDSDAEIAAIAKKLSAKQISIEENVDQLAEAELVELHPEKSLKNPKKPRLNLLRHAKKSSKTVKNPPKDHQNPPQNAEILAKDGKSSTEKTQNPQDKAKKLKIALD